MFAGLLLTAGVAYVVQTNARLLEFASGNFFLLFIAQLAIVFVITGAITRLSATAALALFFVYAATLGLTIGLIVASYTHGTGRDRVPRARRRCSARRRSTARSRSARWPSSAGSCSWASSACSSRCS